MPPRDYRYASEEPGEDELDRESDEPELDEEESEANGDTRGLNLAITAARRLLCGLVDLRDGDRESAGQELDAYARLAAKLQRVSPNLAELLVEGHHGEEA